MSRLYEKVAEGGTLTKAQMTKYNRLATAERQLVDAVNPAIAANKSTLNRLRPEQYDEAFFRAAWAIDNAGGVRLTWGRLNREAILQVLSSEFYRISLERYGMDARIAVRAALNKGLAQGKGYQQMMRDLRDAINTTGARAMRILRTEGQFAVNAGTGAAYTKAIEQGIEGAVVWDATLDTVTRPDHATMDQRTQDPDGTFELPNGERTPYPGWEGLSAGQRINCRCRTRFEIKGYAPVIRRTREQGIVPYQSYGEWRS
jgi:uncharacterized protein with gpF-like domain